MNLTSTSTTLVESLFKKKNILDTLHANPIDESEFWWNSKTLYRLSALVDRRNDWRAILMELNDVTTNSADWEHVVSHDAPTRKIIEWPSEPVYHINTVVSQTRVRSLVQSRYSRM